MKSKVKTFMGFDQSSAKYKVLGMSQKVGLWKERACDDLWGNHQILRLEKEGSSSWRHITCNIPHGLFLFAVKCKSVCIGGILFKAAVLPDNKCSVIHLNLSTERFGCNIVPLLGSYTLASGLFDFKGKVGVCFYTGDIHKVYILEDMNMWSSFMVEPPQCVLQQLKPFSRLSFEGFTRRGDRVFSEVEWSSFYLHYCDVSTQEAEKILIQQPTPTGLRRFSFWNHVESFMLCSYED